MMTKVDVKILSSTRVFSSSDTNRKPSRTLLSIVDAACANFSPTGALWYLGPARDEKCFDVQRLQDSFGRTLRSFPHFEGRLRMVHRDDAESRASGHAFYNRIEVAYGDDLAPGVQFDLATTGASTEDIVPSAVKQARDTTWNATGLAREGVFLQGSIANAMTAPVENDLGAKVHIPPSVVAQVTSLADGGVVIGIKVSHPLADAHALGLFARHWSNYHAELISCGSSLVSETRIFPFVPELVDQIGVKITDREGRENTVKRALNAPMHRFDWWDNADAPFQSTAMTPPDIMAERPEAKMPLTAGTKMSWEEWDRTSAVEHMVLRFSAADLENLRRGAKHDRVSTLDILIAHIWAAINRARGLSGDGENGQVFADISFGLRTRLNPPLPDDFMGSPLAIVAVPMPGREACLSSDVPAMASNIRHTIDNLTPELLAAHIFGLTQELTPQRIWQCFLGIRHILITSWVHTGVFEVEFGTGQAPRYVHPIMPMVDGCIQIIESTPLQTVSKGPGKWYDNGVNVNVYLAASTTAKLIKDPDLHPTST